MFFKKGPKMSFKNVMMVTKILHVYISVKTKLISDVISNDPTHKNGMFFKKWSKKVFQKCNDGYKNIACLYLSNGARKAYSYNYT